MSWEVIVWSSSRVAPSARSKSDPARRTCCTDACASSHAGVEAPSVRCWTHSALCIPPIFSRTVDRWSVSSTWCRRVSYSLSRILARSTATLRNMSIMDAYPVANRASMCAHKWGKLSSTLAAIPCGWLSTCSQPKNWFCWSTIVRPSWLANSASYSRIREQSITGMSGTGCASNVHTSVGTTANSVAPPTTGLDGPGVPTTMQPSSSTILPLRNCFLIMMQRK